MINPMIIYIKYLVEECYEEDYDPYFAEFWYDNYCFSYTFTEWYFLYKKKMKFSKNYTHTPTKLIIGNEKLYCVKLKHLNHIL